MVEARLRARVLGAPLLRVDGTVLVSPGRLVEPVSERHQVVTASNARRRIEAPGVLLARAAALLEANDVALKRTTHR